MADDLSLRSCGRAGCHWPAAASLSFRYATRQVWLVDLAAEPDPALYDLCPHHADALTVPRGWERVDQRSAGRVVSEPAGRDLDPAAGGTPPGSGGYGRNRYAALTAALPRLARELHGERGAPAAGAGAPQPHDDSRRPERRQPVVPSRDLAPLPAGGLPSAAEGSATDPPAVEGSSPEPEAGRRERAIQQLSCPDPDTEPDEPGGVVVALDAGARRRS